MDHRHIKKCKQIVFSFFHTFFGMKSVRHLQYGLIGSQFPLCVDAQSIFIILSKEFTLMERELWNRKKDINMNVEKIQNEERYALVMDFWLCITILHMIFFAGFSSVPLARPKYQHLLKLKYWSPKSLLAKHCEKRNMNSVFKTSDTSWNFLKLYFKPQKSEQLIK